MSEAQVNGVRLYYEEHGDGDPILCIHGGGSTALMWEDALPALARLGRVIAYDRRGCTRSERPSPYERTTLAEQADDAAALLEALDAAPAIVIGRSLGGSIALDLALRHPQLVRALALLEADAFGVSPGGLEWMEGLRERLRETAARDGVEAVYQALVDEVMGEGVWSSLPSEVQEVLSANGPALLAELHYVEEEHPDATALATIDKPALVVAATDSPAPQREMSDAIAAVLPQARTVAVAGGHLINPASPEVLAFVEELAVTG